MKMHIFLLKIVVENVPDFLKIKFNLRIIY
jgi:hypothetical protein